MKRNAQFQMRLESDLLNKLRERSKDAGITISELCRHIISSPPQLSRIEQRLEEIEKILLMLKQR